MIFFLPYLVRFSLSFWPSIPTDFCSVWRAWPNKDHRSWTHDGLLASAAGRKLQYEKRTPGPNDLRGCILPSRQVDTTGAGSTENLQSKINSLRNLWHWWLCSKVGVSYEFSRILKYFSNFFIRLHILLMLLKKFSFAAAAAFLKQSSILKPLNFMSFFPTFFLSLHKIL